MCAVIAVNKVLNLVPRVPFVANKMAVAPLVTLVNAGLSRTYKNQDFWFICHVILIQDGVMIT